MAEKKVGIVTYCGCDLPKNILSEYDVGILYFVIETETGVFADTDEITAENIIGYMEAGGEKSLSSAPSVEVYRKTFEEYLEKYDEIIHIALSSSLSNSCERGRQAKEEMGEKGKRVHIFDSRHLSTGMGFLVIRAGELASFGFDAEKILADLNELKERISTTFMAKNADYLYRKGLVSSGVKMVCSLLNIHPVLKMKKGKLVLKGIQME
ncbi:MAG: DegV family protein, partial [Huintestinicola sp.]